MHGNNDFFISGLNGEVGKMAVSATCSDSHAVKSFSHHFTTQPPEYKHFDTEKQELCVWCFFDFFH